MTFKRRNNAKKVIKHFLKDAITPFKRRYKAILKGVITPFIKDFHVLNLLKKCCSIRGFVANTKYYIII